MTKIKKYKYRVFIALAFSLFFLLFQTSSVDAVCGDIFTDSRDSQNYSTTTIGTQCWMAENLNIGTRIDAVNEQTDNGTIEKYCVNDNILNCDNYSGTFYQWNEAMQYGTTEGGQGICPTGWHIPTDSELHTLESYLTADGNTCNPSREGVLDCDPAGGAMKEEGSTECGTTDCNSSGFSAQGAGYRDTDGSFTETGFTDYFISSSQGGNGFWAYSAHDQYSTVLRTSAPENIGFSVRCVRDQKILSITNQASNILANQADLNGNLTDLEGEASVDVYFEWGEEGTGMLNSTTQQNKTTTGTFSSTISGLISGVNYEFRAVTTNSNGTTYGEILTFRTNTSPDQPTNPTPADTATGVSVSPTLSVNVSDPDGDSMNVSFYDASDDSQIGTTQTGVASGSTASVSWSGLAENTSYSWYAVANDGIDTTQSSIWSFTTNNLPVISNPTPADTATGVSVSPTLSVNVSDPDGDPMDVSFYDASDGSQIGTTQTGVASGSSTSVSWSGLSETTSYSWYAIADDGASTTQSSIWSFTTATSVTTPTVDTDLANNIASNQADLNGNLTGLGGENNNVYFEWGLQVDGLINSTAKQNKTTTGTFSSTISGLTPETTYEFRAVAENSAGTSYGLTESFTTGGSTPTIYTESAQNISIATGEVTFRGNLVHMGGYGSVDTYFQWGESEGSLTSESISKQTLTTTGYFSETVNLNLVNGDKYYFRAVAENGSGTSYGETDSFTVYTSEGTIILQFNNEIVNIKITKEGLIDLVK